MADEGITSLDKEKLTLGENAKWDQADRAEAVLENILNGEAAEAEAAPQEEKITVTEAIAARPVIDSGTGRTRARVLIVTTDESVLIPNSASRNEYLKLASELDELHVMCLIARDGREAFDRAGNNSWFYQVRSKRWWTLPWAGRRAALEALTWNGVPRPDIIVGVDLFEAGLGAKVIAKTFDRPLQYHVFQDPFDPDFIANDNKDNKWRRRLAKYLLKRAKSIRTANGRLRESLLAQYKKLPDIHVLPRFYNFTHLLSGTPSLNLHQRFPDFVFIMLAFGEMTATSHLQDLFTALHRLLKNPKIGMVVVGDGPARNLFVEKAKLLGIERNVVFEKTAADLVSYYQTADLLVETSAKEDGEIRLLQAAAAGLPAIMVETPLRSDLFKDGVSGFLCPPGDIKCLSDKTAKFINTSALRPQFSKYAKDVALERLHEDPAAHYQALAVSIEATLIQTEK